MGISDWIKNIILKKALRSGIGVAVAFLCSGVVAAELQKLGVTINKTELELGLLALISGGIEALRAWIKNRFNLKFL